MDYTETLSKGWGITWRHKWLWLLTLIPALAGFLSLGLSSIQQRILPTAGQTTSPDVVLSQMGGLLLLNCLILALTLLIWVIGLVTRGGLIAAVAGIDRGESYTFGRAFRAGGRKLLPLLGMSIILMGGFVLFFFIVAMIFVVVLSVGAFAGGGQSDSLLAGLGLVGILGVCCVTLVFIVAALLVNLVYPFAFRGIVLRDLGVIDSISHGWGVVRENLGEIILLYLPFFVISVLLVGLYAAFTFGSSFAAVMAGDPTAMMNGFGWEFYVLFIIWSFISAVLAAWQSATFTLGYEQWMGKGAQLQPLFAEDKL